MTFLRFTNNNNIYFGVLEEDIVRKLSGDFLHGYSPTDETFALENITVECPTIPSKIVCIGLNYSDHIKEFDRITVPDGPVIFLKPPTSCLPHSGDIIMPKISNRVDLEAELAVVIGKTCKNVSEDEAAQYIFGYSCINDVTARDIQKIDGQWTRAKGFDTFCPYGPYVTQMDDPSGLNVQSFVNGKLIQSGNTNQMIRHPFQLVSFVSQVMTLLPGDVIATGTPAGVAPFADGDCVEIDIEHVGRLTNYARNPQE